MFRNQVEEGVCESINARSRLNKRLGDRIATESSIIPIRPLNVMWRQIEGWDDTTARCPLTASEHSR